MSAVKLFLSVYSDGIFKETLVIRDLTLLEHEWSEYSKASDLGIIHVGFVRPKIRLDKNKSHFFGNLLVTASAKWALPSGYKTSSRPVTSMSIDEQKVPTYLLVDGFGQSLQPEDYQHLISYKEIQTEIKQEPFTNLTIVEAAKEVLEFNKKPLTKEEILAHIIDKGLYSFGAQRPLEVLRVQLNRYTVDSNYSKSGEGSLFGKTDKGEFFLLSSQSLSLYGWIKTLAESGSSIPHELLAYNIYDEKSYLINRAFLPRDFQNRADKARYLTLIKTISDNDPSALTEILPETILETPINQLGFTVRVDNVLRSNGFIKLKDGMPYSEATMLAWPNFGRKCISDFCEQLRSYANRFSSTYTDNISRHDDYEESDRGSIVVSSSNAELVAIDSKPLIVHFRDTLNRFKDKERQIIERRTGSNGPVLTLQAVADTMDITRERVRQIQKKYVDKIIKEEFWDDCIAKKIGQLLATRTQPLYLEALELEDPWFKGFFGNYKHLSAIIELFSENEIRIIQVQNSNVITRIKQDVWDNTISKVRSSLKDKAKARTWSRKDIQMFFLSQVNEIGAPELAPCLEREFSEYMQFDSDDTDFSLLIGFGKSAEHAVSAVLEQAEGPLHYSEVTSRASIILGREVDERRVQNALMAQKAKLFGRGTYGLKRHNPLKKDISERIGIVVEKMIYEGPIMKQWHSSELINILREKYPSIPDELDSYILNIILDEREKLTFLNRMIWARADSNQTPNDRIDIADAYTRLLEDNGAPMKGSVLRRKITEIRGVNELQIQPNQRMLQVGPDTWGLIDRDLGVSEEKALRAVDYIHSLLLSSQKGIHLSEVDKVMAGSGLDEYPKPYALLHLAQRDHRFRLAHAMFLGLSKWQDTRRLNFTKAVKRVLDEMQSPMTAAEISMRVEELTELTVDFPISNLLLSQGAQFEPVTKKWIK